MTNILRYAVSAIIGAALAFGLLGAMQVVDIAHAQPLTADDLLGDDFADNTGLGQGELQSTAGNLIYVALGFLGIVAVIITLMGGFKWMTAGGNDEKVAEAKRMLIAGLIGLAIILTAASITRFVLSSILSATQ